MSLSMVATSISSSLDFISFNYDSQQPTQLDYTAYNFYCKSAVAYFVTATSSASLAPRCWNLADSNINATYSCSFIYPSRPFVLIWYFWSCSLFSLIWVRTQRVFSFILEIEFSISFKLSSHSRLRIVSLSFSLVRRVLKSDICLS